MGGREEGERKRPLSASPPTRRSPNGDHGADGAFICRRPALDQPGLAWGFIKPGLSPPLLCYFCVALDGHPRPRFMSSSAPSPPFDLFHLRERHQRVAAASRPSATNDTGDETDPAFFPSLCFSVHFSGAEIIVSLLSAARATNKLASDALAPVSRRPVSLVVERRRCAPLSSGRQKKKALL